MQKTLSVLNEMVENGIIGRYAIGGAVAATYYIEPFRTEDLDIFLELPTLPSGLLSTTGIYTYLAEKGYLPVKEGVNIEGWPVQFLPVYDLLTDDALKNAIEVTFEETKTRVLTAEYLCAIMLQTGRDKDVLRLLEFFAENAVDRSKLILIVEQYGLLSRWHEFRNRFLNESN